MNYECTYQDSVNFKYFCATHRIFLGREEECFLRYGSQPENSERMVYFCHFIGSG